MAVIAVIQQKGGVGKSTITANVAGELVRKGRTVKVLDLDPQQSLVIWASAPREWSSERHRGAGEHR